MECLRLEHIGQIYHAHNGEETAIRDVSFTVEKGELLSIVGPSGCGKSTLLSIVAGLLPPTSGQVFLGGEPLRGYSPRIGYMLQKDNLLEWLTIYQNTLLGLRIRHTLTPRTRMRAETLLRTYGLWPFRDRFPSQLSGGMRQRAALIRTLAVSPDVLLLDEAFSALDYQTRLEVTDDVYAILKQEGVTTLMVTHDIPESISMGDRVLVLSGRPAVVREILPIVFEGGARTPLFCREHPAFTGYFQHIWKELSAHGETG
ncbi:MAG: ABC transporter ATP-binding protein [Clostridia bacterium]|nr:ABC transporter ATP-binding protein [Clostridia bacterium]